MMEETRAQTDRLDATGRLTATLTEFQCLRTEIEWLIRNGMRYQQFAMALAAAGLSAGTVTLTQDPGLYPGLAAAISIVLSWLGILYHWEHVEIHVVASYLQKVVRKKVRQLSGDLSWWHWEEHKLESWKSIGNPDIYRRRLLAFLVVSSLFWVTAAITVIVEWSSLAGERLIKYISLGVLTGAVLLTVRLTIILLTESDIRGNFLEDG